MSKKKKDVPVNEVQDTSSEDLVIKDITVGKESTKNDGSESTSGTAAGLSFRKVVSGFSLCLFVFALFVLIGLYIYGFLHYKNVFMPGSYINGLNVSDYSVDQVVSVLEEGRSDYHIDIYSRDGAGESAFAGTITSDQVNFAFVGMEDEVQKILSKQNVKIWFLYFLGLSHRESYFTPAFSYSNDLFLEQILSLDLLREDQMVAPVDAHISDYDDQAKTFTIVPESYGNALNRDAFLSQFASTSLFNKDADPLHIEEYDLFENPTVFKNDAGLAKNLRRANQISSASLTYDWAGTEVVVDGSVISDWISFSKDWVPTFDESQVLEYVNQQADLLDTYGKEREFTTTLEGTVTISKVKYGWETDREATADAMLNAIKCGYKQEMEPVYTKTAYVKNPGDDIGDSYVEIDLTNQHLYLYSEGELVLDSDFVSGNVRSHCTTPGGLFGVTYKTRNATLRGPGYATPVKYWMPFNGNIGMHDANWRNKFGGDIYLTSGSHGCVNLPTESAKQIYEYVCTGFPVICYYYPDEIVDEMKEKFAASQMTEEELLESPGAEAPEEKTEEEYGAMLRGEETAEEGDTSPATAEE